MHSSPYYNMSQRRWVHLAASVLGFTLAWIFVLVGAGGLIWNLFAFSCPSSSSNPRLRSRPLVMLIGDSITELSADPEALGWGAILQNDYIRSIDIENRGLSGWNTDDFAMYGLPEIINEILTQTTPAIITLWFGANDAALAAGPSESSHVPIEQYKANLVYIVNQFLSSAPDTKLIVLTPPVVDDDHRRQRQVHGGGPSNPIDRTNAQAAEYAVACRDAVSAVAGVTLLDIHSHMMASYPNATERGELLSDGLHLSAKGNRLVYEQVKAAMESLVGESMLTKRQILDP